MLLNITLHCRCGREHIVSQGSVGHQVQCGCGERLQVPSLSEFRTHHGLPPIRPHYPTWISELIRSGDLPPEQHCLVCGQDSTSAVDMIFDTEYEANRRANSYQRLGNIALGSTATRLIEFYREAILGEETFLIPVRISLCPTCGRRVLHAGWRLAIRLAKLLLLVVGFVMIFISLGTGLLLLISSAFLWAIEGQMEHRIRQRLHNLMDQTPEYRAMRLENAGGSIVV